MAKLNPQYQQRHDWQIRLVQAIIDQTFDVETTIDMLFAGFDQANKDAYDDVLHVCDSVIKEFDAKGTLTTAWERERVYGIKTMRKATEALKTKGQSNAKVLHTNRS